MGFRVVARVLLGYPGRLLGYCYAVAKAPRGLLSCCNAAAKVPGWLLGCCYGTRGDC